MRKSNLRHQALAFSKKAFFILPLLILFVFVFLEMSDSHKITKVKAVQQIENFPSNEKTNDSPVFRQFDIWAKQYLDNNLSDQNLSKGQRLALKRREILKRLIQINPQAALERTVSEEIYNCLPAEITKFMEKRISAQGDFIVQVFDEIEAEKPAAHWITREVVFTGTKYQAFVYGRKTAMTTKFDVPLTGIILDDLMAIDEVSGQQEFNRYPSDLDFWEAKISPFRSSSKDSENRQSPWTEGSKKVLIIRVDFPDRVGEPVDQSGSPLSETRAQNVINNAVNPFYVNNSYGKTSLQSPVVTPVVRMPQPQSFYNGFNLNTTMLTDARNAARAAGFETNNFDLDIIAFSFTQNLSFSGSAIIGGKGLFLNGFFDFKTIGHELGHNFGLLHANLWRTTDGTSIGTGANVEYGDAFDLMGGGASQLTHFSAGYKRRLDWLTDANVQTVTQSGVYRVFAFDSVNAPSGVHALKIKKDNSKDYWVEFRQLFTATPSLMNGALVRWDFTAPQGARQTQILDMTPATSTLGDASLLVGQTFTDNTSGITISVLGKGNTEPESLDVQVTFNYSIARGAPFDFDGDNKSDIAVFRPENGAWYLNQSTQGFRGINWGLPTDKIVPAKFNFDRTTDVAVYRDGIWYVYNSFGGNPIIVQFGQTGDIPVPADYDGDGAAEMAVYRPSNGTWYFWNWISRRFTAERFGIETDKPVPADYDGDGRADVAVYRPEAGIWYILRSSQGFTAFQFGIQEDNPVVGDYDGDGKADPAVFRPSNGFWYWQGSTSGFYAAQWGVSTDTPAPGDYDGDGKTDLAVYRSGVWYLLNSAEGFSAAQFGTPTDKPVAAAFVP